MLPAVHHQSANEPPRQHVPRATRTETVTSERWLVRPTVGVRVGFGDVLELGYQLQLDVDRPEASGHLLTLGVRL